MPNCVICGRELPSPNEPNNTCPQCRATIARQHLPPVPSAPRQSVSFSRVPLTTAIIAVNVLVFVAMTLTGVSPVHPGLEDLVKWGADVGTFTLLRQPWRMLTSNYVHDGILHIGFNMWCLWSLGALAERIFDRWTYFFTYCFCGLGGSLASIVIHPNGEGVGASGAIFGVAGALIAALYLGHLPVHPGALKATLKSLLSFAAYNLIFGALIPGIDNSAHVGGLLTGLAIGGALAPHLASPPEERSAWNRWILAASACLLLLAFYVARHFATPL